MTKTVTVFGSSIPRLGDVEYDNAYKLGKILGEKKINVCSGGHQGIMDAVSKGATETGGEAIGITVNLFSSTPSRYLTKHIECANLFERIGKLVEIADAFVILKGGTGTLLELAVIWEYLNKGLMEEKPVAVHGDMWKEILNIMEKQIEFEKRKTGLIKYYDTIEEITDYIINSLQ